MRNVIFTLLLFSTLIANGQIISQNYDNGSITITPKGIRDKTTDEYNATNVVLGGSALTKNKSSFNVAIGLGALSENVFGSGNVGTGFNALGNVKNGGLNTSCGYYAGYLIGMGENNTILGAYADVTNDFSNATAIGALTKVNASNKVRIGNESITVIEGQVAWSNPSDRRLKENIVYSNQLGLDFINRLQTTSYNYKADKNKTRYDGFIAQDVEQVMKELGVPFSGLKKSDDGMYSLAYSDFVMPLVNAVKEQQQQIQEQQQQINELKRQNEVLAQTLSDLKEIRAEIKKLSEESKNRTSERK